MKNSLINTFSLIIALALLPFTVTATQIYNGSMGATQNFICDYFEIGACDTIKNEGSVRACNMAKNAAYNDAIQNCVASGLNYNTCNNSYWYYQTRETSFGYQSATCIMDVTIYVDP